MLRIVPILLLLLGGCAEAPDTPGLKSPGVSSETSKVTAESNASESSKSFSLEASKTANAPGLDVIIVADNSSGMDRAIQKLRSSVSTFNAHASAKYDVRYAVISRKGNIATRFEFPEDISVLSTVDIFVGSTNAMALAAASLCDSVGTQVKRASYSDPSIGTVCSEPLREEQSNGKDTINAWYHIPSFVSAVNSDAVRGALSSFFRPEAKKAFVFVSDHDSLGVDDRAFVKILSRLSISAKVFAFRSLGAQSSCSQEGSGDGYDAIAEATGGLTFDICDENWSNHFARIAENL